MRPGLERAARIGDFDGVESELAAGADVNSLDRYGQTALMLAAPRGHLAVVQCLVRHGANLDVRAKFGLSALMLAIVSKQDAVACALDTWSPAERSGSQSAGFNGNRQDSRESTSLLWRRTPCAGHA